MIGPMLVELLAAGGVAAIVGVVDFVKAHRRSEKQSRLAAWRTAVAANGLTDVVERSATEMTARKGERLVRLRAFVATGENRGTRVSVEGVPRWLAIRRASPNSPSPSAVATGDLAFDVRIAVDGPELEVRAALDAASRRRHLVLFAPQAAGDTLFSHSGVDPEIAVAGGRLETRRPDEPVQERADRVRVAVETLLALAECWTASSPEERAAANACQDPVPEVRLLNLRALVRDAPGHPALAPALERARADVDPEVRLTAALASGPAGRDVLRAFLGDESTTDGVAARATEALGPVADETELHRWLSAARAARKPGWSCACLRHLARPGVPVSPVLLDALVDDAREVRETAVALLGNLGSSAAHVVELRRVAEMYAHDAPFVRASRASVAAIQSRLVGAERGQLAVASDAGELSLAGDESGRVSLGVPPAPGGEG